MRTILTAVVVLFTLTAAAMRAAEPPPENDPNANTLTDAEKAEGWALLFDGKTLNGWHRYRNNADPAAATQPVQPTGWTVENGELARTKRAGDLITDENFERFELVFQWKISPGGNSGVIYHVSEDHHEPYETGPEYQVLDNSKHPDGKNPLTSAASCYALYAPPHDVTAPVGQWNQGRIIVIGSHVEHWLNGEKVVEYEKGSDDWNAKVAASKFRSMKNFGKPTKGHIALQDHGDEVAYRSIKIRELKAAP
jgi:hypothetical protein